MSGRESSRGNRWRRCLPADLKVSFSMSDSTTPADRSRNAQSGPAHVPETFRLAKKSDLCAFERLYRRCGSGVYGLCLRIIGDPAEAEQVAQDVFLKAFRKIQTVRRQSQLEAWLHRLAASVAIKKALTSPAKASLDPRAEPSNENCSRPIPSGAPEASVRGSLSSSDLAKAFDQLPEECRTVFLLHDVERFDHTEIAEILRCSVQQSKSILFKARLHLRTLLHETLRNRVQHEPQKVGTQQPAGILASAQ